MANDGTHSTSVSAMPRLVKQVIRRGVDRVLTPHLEAQTDEIERRLTGRAAAHDAEPAAADQLDVREVLDTEINRHACPRTPPPTRRPD